MWLFGGDLARIDIVLGDDVIIRLSRKGTAPGTTRAGLSKNERAP